MGLDIPGAALVIFACIIICQAARIHDLYGQRDRQFERAEVERHNADIFQARNRDLEAKLTHAESLSTVVPLFKGGLDEVAETYTWPGDAS